MAYAFNGQMTLDYRASWTEDVLHQGLIVDENLSNTKLCVIKAPTSSGYNYYLCGLGDMSEFHYRGSHYDNSSTQTSIEPLVGEFHGTLPYWVADDGTVTFNQPTSLNGVWLTDYGQGVTSTNISIPMFDASQIGTEDFNKYLHDGDDSGCINYPDVHPTKYAFYISNDGNIVKINYEPRVGTEPTMAYYKVTHFGIYGAEEVLVEHATAQQNLTWDFIGRLSSKEYINIKGYNSTETELFWLQAIVTRKTLVFFGEVSTSISIGESNGHTLSKIGDEQIENIGQDQNEESDAEGDKHNPIRFSGYSKLLTTYRLSENDLAQLGDFIWSNDIKENIYLMNNDPMENLVSLKYVPISLPMKRSSNVMIGNIDTGVSANEIQGIHFAKKNIGSFSVPQYTDGFLNYGFTKVQLYLPMHGMIDLKSEDVVGYTISVVFMADVICGTYGYCVYTNKGGGTTLIYSCQGSCGIDIPLAQSNRAQLEVGYIEQSASAIASAFRQDFGGAISDLVGAYTQQHHTQTYSSPSSMLGAITPCNCYLIVRYPIINNPTNFGHTKGWLCRQAYKLKDLKGFTKLDNSIEIKGTHFSKEGNEELKQILTSGFYI